MASNMPKPEAVRALLQSTEPGKVVMLNLLKFKPAGGAASYMEYVRGVTPILERIGAKVVFAGPVMSTVVLRKNNLLWLKPA
jgi:hypothetical protein